MMPFEVFQACGGRAGIPRGMVSISARGMARFHSADLADAAISNVATILIDRKARSLALRAPLEGEQGLLVGRENGSRCKTVWLAGAIGAIGLDPAGLHGWHECAVVEDRLEIRLTGKAG